VRLSRQRLFNQDHVHTKTKCVLKSTTWLPGICKQVRPDLLRSDLQVLCETSRLCGLSNKALTLDRACTLFSAEKTCRCHA